MCSIDAVRAVDVGECSISILLGRRMHLKCELRGIGER